MRPHVWKEDEIFVFGSNLLGAHGAGAAAWAHFHCNAVMGVAEGMTGNSYAIPTVKVPRVHLPLSEIKLAVERFISFANNNPDKRFFLTKIGCGLAGFAESDIRPLFVDVPRNVRMPPDWLV